jgi:hypothetical protein
VISDTLPASACGLLISPGLTAMFMATVSVRRGMLSPSNLPDPDRVAPMPVG